MTFAEFVDWLRGLADERQLTRQQVEDLILQRTLFDAERQMIETEYLGLVVGYCARERLVDETVVGLLDRVVEVYHGRQQVYFEPIGVSAFGAELR